MSDRHNKFKFPPVNLLGEPDVTLQLAQNHGLTEEEFLKIIKILGRSPTYTELGIFSVMWSEHCSYKNSILLLKTLPRSGGRLLVDAGEENAGLVRLDDNFAIAFKIESHNHPSAVEPYQGAATGVGGILRDIFTMGAKPIANLVSLRFGDPTNSRTKYLLDGVVRGIADYGNCMGVPTVAGEVTFDESYHTNPLVNAMTVGVVEIGSTISATSSGNGNLVYYIGNKTGRDGIHGATFASDELSEDSTSKRPNVQVGDPFTEKLLMEAVRELARENVLIGLQDMGAAGISCSTSEMSARGNSGMEIELNSVPLREEKMTPYEIMLSESQERMLAVCTTENSKRLEEICNKWGIICSQIGKVSSRGTLDVYFDKQLVAEIPSKSLVLGGDAPQYKRDSIVPTVLLAKQKKKIDYSIFPSNDECFQKLIVETNIASKRWIFRQFDHTVIGNTVKKPQEADSAVLKVTGSEKGIAVKTDCNPYWVEIDPYWGTANAVAESALNVACTGAMPAAITNCLNFGNPYKPTSFHYFREAIRGMGDACRALETPVSGGNVSFYNESVDGSVLPTPTIGMLGILDHISDAIGCGTIKDRALVLVGAETKLELGGSSLIRLFTKSNFGDIPKLDLTLHKKLIHFLVSNVQSKIIESAHDCSDGGLAICLAEMAINGECGLHITAKLDNRLKWFSETPSRAVVSIDDKNYSLLESSAKKSSLFIQKLGTSVGENVILDDWLNLPRYECIQLFEGAISKLIEEK